ncbi:hypothetical protein M0M42_16515 [Pseudomonas knackmussii]|uniref:Secreted protein n=1 Tax=Pseudomonas knackmussii TaxID=65741 RepID=A0ABY4KQG7_9PSED|nr:hypothetical protein [Pseudomonas knackmussii]UPQ81988.1 hypothetical protein M0M42_16515 [Pseudomonas knackmussii]
MKKILLSSLMMALSAGASAAAYTPGQNSATAGVANPTVFTYTATANRAGFVKNDFDFTVSANTIVRATENGSRSMAVAAVSGRGRNLFTGHSDGGSVSQCGASLTADAAKTEATVVALLSNLNVANANGCGQAPANP